MASTLFDLSGQVALITGSSRGIGKAIAEEMSAAGAKVVISSRKQDACDAVRDQIKAAGGDAVSITCNIGNKPEVEHLVKATLEHFGRIDILVCNAAVNPYYGPLSKLGDDAWDKIMVSNVKSSWWFANLVAPHMMERGSGNIILVSSIGAFRSTTVLGAYGISKAAEAQLARNLASELGPSGIRVNAIAPGLVKTDFAKALWSNPQLLKSVETRAPLRRIGQPVDIGGVAVFLASKAASFVTGQLIVADGGSSSGD
ncbi:MAG TPA: SDR family oxidoreductase [Steroidobacteraceae bacterium]|jgi:NAD(P)-dependent dehydrogenase (short-subunit alcohol dehydrogenase family)